MIGGFWRLFVEVDLSSEGVNVKTYDVELAKKFIGGTGLATKILYDEVGPRVDPFDEDNVLIASSGPLVATGAPMACRVDLVTRSPLTGLIGLSNAGGFWASHLKRSGYDMVIIRGQARSPLYIWINDGKVELRDACEIWSRYDAWSTVEAVRRDVEEHYGIKDLSVMAIGPAGENLVRYASVVVDKYHVAGRCGCGAVLGKKKVKAIAIHGSRKVPLANPQKFREAVMKALRRILQDPSYKLFSSFASLPLSEKIMRKGALPGRNWQTAEVKNWNARMTLEAAVRYIVPKGRADLREARCSHCPVQCFNQVEVDEGPFKGLKIGGGTFVRPILEFGAKCGVSGIPAAWRCRELCNRLGLDEASAACAVAFAMEMRQRGRIGGGGTGELKLAWGSDEEVFKVLRWIAYREGIGNLLADGVAAAAKRIGGDAEEAAIVVKNMELMGSDPRVGSRAWHLGTLINPRGGDNVRTTHFGIEGKHFESVGFHTRVNDELLVEWLDMPREVKRGIFGDPPVIDEHTFKGKALMVKWYSLLTTVMNALGVCIFASMGLDALGPTHYAEMYSAATGLELGPGELMKAGERIFNLQRMYNARMGARKEMDVWPSRFYTPMTDGPARGACLSRDAVEEALCEVYELMGWDRQSGLPTKRKLEELELTAEACMLY
ncbi:MAG: aldehyde ferredoxin oxidoreductase family protein [Candidatus Nezhaarchaeota archaeon]|nr:aldehyde ferredoxin oxidoreductase family protein [Candidatus Nezhaarchaeota archaeon]